MRANLTKFADVCRFVAKMNAQLTVDEVLTHAETLMDLTRRQRTTTAKGARKGKGAVGSASEKGGTA